MVEPGDALSSDPTPPAPESVPGVGDTPPQPKTIATYLILASVILALVGLAMAGIAWSFGALRIPLLGTPPPYLGPRLGLVGVVLALIGLWRVRRIRRAMVVVGTLGVLLNVVAVGLEFAASKVIPSTIRVRGEVVGPSALTGRTIVFRAPEGDLLATTILGDPSEYECTWFFVISCEGWASYSVTLPGRRAYVVEVDQLGARRIAYGDLFRQGFQYDIDFGPKLIPT